MFRAWPKGRQGKPQRTQRRRRERRGLSVLCASPANSAVPLAGLGAAWPAGEGTGAALDSQNPAFLALSVDDHVGGDALGRGEEGAELAGFVEAQQMLGGDPNLRDRKSVV